MANNVWIDDKTYRAETCNSYWSIVIASQRKHWSVVDCEVWCCNLLLYLPLPLENQNWGLMNASLTSKSVESQPQKWKLSPPGHNPTISPLCALCSGTVVCPPRPRRRHCGSGARWSLTAVVPVPDGGDRSAVNMESCPRAEKLGCRWLCWFSPSSSLHRGRKVKQM